MNCTETFIYLTYCGLTGQTAQLDSAPLDKLYTLAAAHSMTALIAKALSPTKAFADADKDMQKKWQGALDGAIKRTMLFASEQKIITRFLEENQIWYVLLKGAVISKLYPHFGTREFVDNDILYDSSRTEKVKRFMLGRGYTLQKDFFAADEYIKPPLYNFEMHPKLFEDDTEDKSWFVFYEHMLARLRGEDGKFARCMTDDDFYIYFIIHAYKHYEGCGTGFRTVADEYIILNSPQFHFDFANIDRELDALNMRTFEQHLRGLSTKLFASPDTQEALKTLDAGENGMLYFVLSCGTFGTKENLFVKEFQAMSADRPPSKLRYYLRRIFPPVSRFRYSNPFVYKHKIVYPFFLLYRMIVKPIQHRKTLKQELKTIKNIDNQ